MYLFILVGCDGNEFGLFKHVGPKRTVRKFQDVVCPYEMKSRLVLVHRVEDSLKLDVLSMNIRSVQIPNHFTKINSI